MNTEQLYEIFLQHPTVTTDSRHCPEGSIFFALRGESFDGNTFAAAALAAGCAYAVVDEHEYATDPRCLLVSDVLETLQQLAALHRRKWGHTILQITGTNGKTTTKELIAAVLGQKYQVLYTEGNQNNHIGVPLTLLRLRQEHEVAVIETGANHPGEIAALCNIVQPDCGLVTNVGRAHLQGFGSFEGVKRTKGELYDYLKSHDGLVFINAFDDHLRIMAEDRGLNRMIPYVEGRVADCSHLISVQWRADVDEPWHTIQTQLVGTYNIENIRAAATVGHWLGVEADKIDAAIGHYVPTNSRSQLQQTARNRLIVDTYNANPTSMAAALTNFTFFEAENKMLILGEMRELGEDSVAEHQRIIRQATEMVGADTIWLVGEAFSQAASTMIDRPRGEIRFFRSVEQVKDALSATPLTGRTILIKGSNATRLFELPALL